MGGERAGPVLRLDVLGDARWPGPRAARVEEHAAHRLEVDRRPFRRRARAEHAGEAATGDVDHGVRGAGPAGLDLPARAVTCVPVGSARPAASRAAAMPADRHSVRGSRPSSSARGSPVCTASPSRTHRDASGAYTRCRWRGTGSGPCGGRRRRAGRRAADADLARGVTLRLPVERRGRLELHRASDGTGARGDREGVVVVPGVHGDPVVAPVMASPPPATRRNGRASAPRSPSRGPPAGRRRERRRPGGRPRRAPRGRAGGHRRSAAG